MNAVEIEEAISALVAAPFDAAEFPFQFLAAFGNKDTTVRRLRGGANASDVPGGVLQRNNIHLATCTPGEVGATLKALRESPKTASAKVKFVLATDGVEIEAEEIATGDVLACAYGELDKHFGFLLPLAGISTVREIKNNPIDIKATGRLNKLYLELLKTNPDWESEARRHELNQFMARLIFCFFAEDTGIFLPDLFTLTIAKMTNSQSTNTHEIIAELFRVMDVKRELRVPSNIPRWAENFPYVNGGLFTESIDCPRFSRIARAYLLRAGELDWKQINPDIFGSMIQAVADDGERGSLGMHYTSVPNILKVLNPLFLDDLREQFAAAGDNARKLKNLRRRLAHIRVFDPACGSGNFLVIAYKEMREIEWEIIQRLGDLNSPTEIRLENFYGIEIKSFPVEIAKLSLLIAEFQCNVRFYGEQVAWMNVLPLHRTGQIHVGNALRMDWKEVCPPGERNVSEEWDLGGPTGRLALEDSGLAESKQLEIYICGNPPYKGSQGQDAEQKTDLEIAFSGALASTNSADYVAGWFFKGCQMVIELGACFAFVSTNSLHQGRQVPLLWDVLFGEGVEIAFATASLKWSNLAAKEATVTVSITGASRPSNKTKFLFESDKKLRVQSIGPYLLPNNTMFVEARAKSVSNLPPMNYGSMPNDGGHLLMTKAEAKNLIEEVPSANPLIKEFWGAGEVIEGIPRYCLWVEEKDLGLANSIPQLSARFAKVRAQRASTTRKTTNILAETPWRFGEVRQRGDDWPVIIPIHTGETRLALPIAILKRGAIVSNACYLMTNTPLWVLALISSRCHLVWIATVCGKLETRYRYSNTLGWNTFPVPPLSCRQKSDLGRCAENILLARESYFPATIDALYKPELMPDDLRRAHEQNDETLERIYIGRRFKNDTERLEKLFDMYSKMIEAEKAATPAKGKAKKPKAVS